MRVQWVIGRYQGAAAKQVKAHADAGIGYFIRQESGVGAQYTVAVAFRRPTSTDLPPHLEVANPTIAAYLDALLMTKMGKHAAA